MQQQNIDITHIYAKIQHPNSRHEFGARTPIGTGPARRGFSPEGYNFTSIDDKTAYIETGCY